MVTCQKVIRTIEQFAPKELAAEWDNTGLQLGGHPLEEIQSLLVTLDVTEEVLDEAIALGVGMIVCHHPLIFKPLKTIVYDTPVGKLVAKAIKANIHIYSAHTNADSCALGVNYCLARKIGLKDVKVLQSAGLKLFKIIVYVPEGYEHKVREAMGEAGAGWLGDYSHCSFMAKGTGTFKPLSGTKPFLGKQGQLEEVSEYRIETIVPENILHQTIQKMLEVHPYEEVAYDIYPLANPDARQGMGRIGNLPEPIALGRLAEQIKQELAVPWVLVSGSSQELVQKIAVCGGSGAEFIQLAKAQKAQVLVTGDVKYHDALTAKQLGLSIIDPGHNGTERILVPVLAEYLRAQLNIGREEVVVYESAIETNPWESVIG